VSLPILSNYLNNDPCEHARFVRLPCDFTQQLAWAFDLSIMVRLQAMMNLQSVFVDNANGLQPMRITIPGTGQRIVCPAQCQGLFPLLFTWDDGRIQIQNADDTLIAFVFLMNIPIIAPVLWHPLIISSDSILDSDNQPITDSDGNPIEEN